VSALPVRTKLHHDVPSWAADNATYFVTICTEARRVNHLCFPDVGHHVLESAVYRQTLMQWWLHLCLLMPDHVHMLVRPMERPGLAHAIYEWKKYTARHFRISWQRDFFDHRLRANESLLEKAEYILQNPVRAGLVADAREWPYVWKNPR
jgi:putative transposase